MKGSERIVLDNDALISRLLLPASIPGQAVRKAVEECQILVSEPTLAELADVLSRPKFDPYVSIGDRQDFLRLLGRIAVVVPVTFAVHACRDPKDNKFLEVAVNGPADLIVTGDQDLLILHPFHNIPVLSPAAFLAR